MAYLSYCVFFFALIIMSVCVWLAVANSFATNTGKLITSESEGELVFVHVLYRHGDRNPIGPTLGSEYADIAYWPEGWGQLTNLGVQQLFSLGQWLRRRYSGFLGDNYNLNDFYVRSSDIDRALMSAQSTLAGLYPPFGQKIWNKNLLWQPIPVHTVPVNMDYLIAGKVPTCPSYQNALSRYVASDKMRKLHNSIQPIYDYITTNTGTKVKSLYELALTRDSWLCESIHNYTHPQWIHKLYPNNEDFEQAAMKFYYLFTGTKFMAKFMSGFLLKDILDRCKSKVQKTLSPDRKFWMYSSHDTTVFSLLHSLDISDKKFVPYAAAVIFELWKFENEYYVQIFYKNSERNPQASLIPGCGTACPLSKMYEIYDDIIPKNDFNTECLITETETDQE